MVSDVDGGRLLLTDSEGIDEADAEDALLEPRQENLEVVIGAVYGGSAPDVISRLRQLRGPYGSAAGKRDKCPPSLSIAKVNRLPQTSP